MTLTLTDAGKRKEREMKIVRLKVDLEKARQKAAEWQARAKDIER